MGKYKKQKDGRYKTTVSTGKYRPDGKPIKLYISAYSIKELEEKVAQAKTDVMTESLIFDRDTKFGAYARKWLEIYKSNRGVATISMYRNILNNHCGSISDIPLCNISRVMIQQMVNERSDHPRTCEQIVLTVKQILRSAVQEGLLNKNVCSGIDLPRHIKKEKRILTEEEVQKLKNYVLPLEERAFIATLYGTGMRSAEMYALNKEDIDFNACTIRVSKSVVFENNYPQISYPKTDAGIRTIIVSKSLIRLLKDYCGTINHSNLFGDKEGNLKMKWAYRDYFDHIVHKVFGAKTDITPHCLRHTFCTLCYESGMSLKACQIQMGHSSYKMVLDVYTHLDAKRENVQAKMDNICL